MKPGWSKPHTHSNPTNLALFRHKITLYRFNQVGLILLQGGGLKWEQGAEPPPLPLLTLTTEVSNPRPIVYAVVTATSLSLISFRFDLDSTDVRRAFDCLSAIIKCTWT